MKTLMSLMLGFILFAWSFTVVEDNFVLVATNNITHKVTLEKQGYHFNLLGLYNLRKVYINNRLSDGVIQLNLSSPEGGVREYSVKLLLQWQVVDPLKYIEFLPSIKKVSIDKILFNYLSEYLANKYHSFDDVNLQRANKYNSLESFNQQADLITPMPFDDVGIRLISLRVASIKVLK